MLSNNRTLKAQACNQGDIILLVNLISPLFWKSITNLKKWLAATALSLL